ncbi:MAG: aspartate/glutamate racemase family protein [Mycobacteriales bacterium]
MKTIGLLGGMSWESSAVYYRIINELVRDRLGGLHSADCLMYSLDFGPVAQAQKEGRWEEAAAALVSAGQTLQRGGADFLVLCTNTMHKVADQLAAGVKIPLLHLIDTTAQAIGRAGMSRVGLLGTAFTMEQSFYRDRLSSHGIDTVTPNTTDRELVHRVIYEELCQGVVREESRQAYQRVIERLAVAGAQGVILGCTEIELLIAAKDSVVPVFPTTALHAEAAVDLALSSHV